jgi:uncharacterized damage-inducible protein DinB
MLPDQFRRWFNYEKDSHRRVLDSFRTVPAERHDDSTFQKAVNLMGHIIAARRMWLYRLGAMIQRPANLFPSDVAVQELTGALEAMERDWARYLERLDEPEVTRVVTYQSVEGDWFRNGVADILTQLHGHSLYHRGQIASLVRAAGGEPAATDFIFWSRESTAPPAA